MAHTKVPWRHLNLFIKNSVAEQKCCCSREKYINILFPCRSGAEEDKSCFVILTFLSLLQNEYVYITKCM
jgi:hypothetical protein